MSAQKKSPSSIDTLTAQLASVVSAPERAGKEQAGKAIDKKVEQPAKPPITRSKPKLAVAAKKPKPTVERAGKAEKVSVSLHPIDQERAERVEDALRKAGLVGRRAPTSFLLKIALAAFDENKVEDLAAIVEKVRSQDGRGKWMHHAKGVK